MSLKDKVDGDIYVSGSGTLVRAMLADGLVDELHLFVYPVARGEGERLLAGDGPATKLAPRRIRGLQQRGRAPQLRPCHSRCDLTQSAMRGERARRDLPPASNRLEPQAVSQGGAVGGFGAEQDRGAAARRKYRCAGCSQVKPIPPSTWIASAVMCV